MAPRTRQPRHSDTNVKNFPGPRKSPENTRQAELHQELMSAVAGQETASVEYGAKLVAAISGKVWEAPEIAGTLADVTVPGPFGKQVKVTGWQAYYVKYLRESDVRMTSKGITEYLVPLGDALVNSADVPADQLKNRIAELVGVTNEAIRQRLENMGKDAPEWNVQYAKKESKGSGKGSKPATQDQVKTAIETMSAKEAADLISETLTEDKRAELADLLWDGDDESAGESAPESIDFTSPAAFVASVKETGMDRKAVRNLIRALEDEFDL